MILTRRNFITLATAGTLASRKLYAADPDYTIVVVPDTQYLAMSCSSAFSNMMQWVVNNLNASQGGVFTTNVKAVVGVGDCTNNDTSGEFSAAQTAYALLSTAGVPWINPPGNHDYYGSGSSGTDRAQVGSGYSNPSGYFAAAVRAAASYGAIPTGGVSAWIDSYDQANYCIRLLIGGRRILVFSVEMAPRGAVFTWAKAIHDFHPGDECIISTHSFLSDTNSLGTYTNEPGNNPYDNDNSGQGFVADALVSNSNMNSGYGCWNSYLKTWSNLTLVVSGHYFYEPWHQQGGSGAYNSWMYQTKALTSSSSRSQTVQGMFCNWQEADAGNYGGPIPGGGGDVGFGTSCAQSGVGRTARIAHLLLLQFRPSIGKLEGYSLSTWSGLWEPSAVNKANSPGSTPQLLFSIDYAGIPSGFLSGRPVLSGTWR